MKSLPNILTGSRLVMALFMFVAFAAAAGAVPYFSNRLEPDIQFALQRWAVYAFVVAALTDFVDGWLARKLNAETVWGAILDPIGDKVLVCGAILGLMSLGPQPWVVLPAGLILFREFTVSALREVGAGKGVKLPVTLLAKWKTTLQLTALAMELIVAAWGAFPLLPQDGTAFRAGFEVAAHSLFWIAALVTLITGVQYWEQTRKALAAQPTAP
ncbi:MAG: CDP-diacylglycerol--glycerol-3-phosphate 3-phosphatidyltransferase [Alphaproteobacteria bacterium]|nr:CDP-diacylglycerol--glycerol-3-phosphate 3-phosphatidyltransferase [Alphaproteobacteria bacterium]MBU1515993.1 CDP-diacylglycerol--glycerol-3-phosphate 3-phosphatidyltransferase [Alphaproteobacteria bacterium]MBU2092792.1 CDP-diacylglycerol--glycerol-3-phosphate 3-phosphatidyltransferase [Alphaproteobacteria bacterium]MBU2153683.1 CDP-diacylglycerol--glycerol-3-phosphate 3-phosphatidyltransferase [Alphaproteobacteria bacterium]MBU2308311.1 CDP-diacylglycerol--glycerol-3-phosphate 3-phosphati